MPVIFFDKSSAPYDIPSGFKKYEPRTRSQKLEYKVELMKELARLRKIIGFTSTTPKELEALGERAEKLLLENSLDIYVAPDNAINVNSNDYVVEESFAPEGYAESLTVAENTAKATKKAQQEKNKKTIAEITSQVNLIPLNTSASSVTSSTPMIPNSTKLPNVQSAIQRHEQYLKQAQALKEEAVAALKTKGISKNLRAKATEQYKLAKAYNYLARSALNQYRHNLSGLGVNSSASAAPAPAPAPAVTNNMMIESEGGSRRKTHRRNRTHRKNKSSYTRNRK